MDHSAHAPNDGRLFYMATCATPVIQVVFLSVLYL